MTRFRRCVYVVTFAVCVLLVWLAWTSRREQQRFNGVSAVPSTSPSPTILEHAPFNAPHKLETTASAEGIAKSIHRDVVETLPVMRDISGTVWNAPPDLAEEFFTKIERAASNEEFRQAIKREAIRQPSPNVTVTARGQHVTKEVVTDSNGRFKIAFLPLGIYEVSAEVLSQPSEVGTKRMATARKRAMVDKDRTLDLQLRRDIITIRGRISDDSGRPAAGVKVTGEVSPYPDSGDAGLPDMVSAVSSDDGTYELQGFDPPGLYRWQSARKSGPRRHANQGHP